MKNLIYFLFGTATVLVALSWMSFAGIQDRARAVPESVLFDLNNATGDTIDAGDYCYWFTEINCRGKSCEGLFTKEERALYDDGDRSACIGDNVVEELSCIFELPSEDDMYDEDAIHDAIIQACFWD